MQDEDKTKEQLICEMSSLRQRMRELESRSPDAETLQVQAGRLGSMLDDVPIGFAVFNRDLTVLWVNQMLAAMFSSDPELMVGRNVYDVWPEASDLRDIYDRVLQGEAIDFRTQKIQYPQGDRYFEVHYRPVSHITGALAGLLLVSIDITERIRAEDAVEKRSEELARSNAELEQFAYVASHDLQEPLRSLVGFTSLLERRYRSVLEETGSAYITRIVNAATRMQQLINDLLTYSRVGRGTEGFDASDCGSLLDLELESLRASIQKSGAHVTRDVLPTLNSHPALIGQIFRNLVSNAIKFRAQEPPRIHVSASQTNSDWVFAIRDNGIGIEPQYADRIFSIFQRLHTREEYPGTGIGLSVCKKAVEQLGGRIWVESEYGKGSTFSFTIPVSKYEGSIETSAPPTHDFN